MPKKIRYCTKLSVLLRILVNAHETPKAPFCGNETIRTNPLLDFSSIFKRLSQARQARQDRPSRTHFITPGNLLLPLPLL